MPIPHYKQSETVVARTIAGETLIVPVRGGVGDLASIYSLNELGSFLWRNLKTARTLDQLIDLVMREYEVEMNVAMRDVDAFLTEIKAAGLINEVFSPEERIGAVAATVRLDAVHAETR